MESYTSPAITDLGSFADLTLKKTTHTTKVTGTGDVLTFNGVDTISALVSFS